MKSLAEFCVRFDNPYAIYYSGQQVTGRIYIRLVRPKRMRGGEITLPPGEHYYPFSLILPQTLPSSFEGQLGHVRYICKGLVLRPWRFDHECKFAFTVLNPLDLNFEPNLQDPLHSTRETYLGCCCCRSGPLTLVVSSKLQGYVPGQKIQAVVEVDNPTKKDVTVKCALIQTSTFTGAWQACTQTKAVNVPVAQCTLGHVPRRSSRTTPVDLQVPALPASHLRNCSTMDIA
ncbi:uncharacterized protein GBIM_09561, partial [Gryllus bimaculatus]